ncbi:MAG: protein-tyrosine phosphatase [Chloroflexia bacterium]|jgi:protein-tyrosine phosphatase|nr:protein-tyrosine phosphatase [Chloroflexia bacterium]
MTQEPQTRHLQWDACYNARETGGYPAGSGSQTRWRALVRADNLHRLTPGGQAALCDYGIRTIIDLRLAHELERHPNPFAVQESNDGPRYLNLPLHDVEIDADIDAAMPTQDDYIVILERGKGLVGAVIKAVAASLEDGAVLVHCHGGKDRTGIVVALLLSLAGVPLDTIVEDYALSEAMLAGPNLAWLEEQSKTQGRPLEKPLWMFAHPEKMRRTLEYLDRKYGRVEGYLAECGVTEAEMAQIREHLIAPTQVVDNH